MLKSYNSLESGCACLPAGRAQSREAGSRNIIIIGVTGTWSKALSSESS